MIKKRIFRDNLTEIQNEIDLLDHIFYENEQSTIFFHEKLYEIKDTGRVLVNKHRKIYPKPFILEVFVEEIILEDIKFEES